MAKTSVGVPASTTRSAAPVDKDLYSLGLAITGHNVAQLLFSHGARQVSNVEITWLRLRAGLTCKGDAKSLPLDLPTIKLLNRFFRVLCKI